LPDVTVICVRHLFDYVLFRYVEDMERKDCLSGLPAKSCRDHFRALTNCVPLSA
jgi:hypothetical protein